jgi:superfamily II DNA or RNA helicase
LALREYQPIGLDKFLTNRYQQKSMQNNPFQTREPNIAENLQIRTPQREAYAELAKFATGTDAQEREIGIVLPVGCGKSGCITLTPFAFKACRALVIAPGIHIAKQLHDDFDPAREDMFYLKCDVLRGSPFPEPVEIRGTVTNRSDLDAADVVITNIHQLQGEKNRWLEDLPHDFFDLILFDEGHHNVAASWDALRVKFPAAKIVNFSATPCRADGQLMTGRIIYSFPVFRAIQEGYIKRLKAKVLNPRTLRYVQHKDGQEIEVSLDEVRRLGEVDSDFRRSIVTSAETLNTIVNASIRELNRLRKNAGDNRLKIIASALNFEHCRQIVEAYRERGLRADYVHSLEDSQANNQVMQKLEIHKLDVIVQVRKLGEGFDHPFLAVAAIFSIFRNLSPFIQFVGRVMRVIEHNSPGHPLNNGVVVFHAGANIASRWEDFRQYSEADQEYFDQLLPLENLDFSNADELEIEPEESVPRRVNTLHVRGQTDVTIEEIALIQDDPKALAALRTLQEKGFTADQVKEAFEQLHQVPVTKVRKRQAKRTGLDHRVRTEAARVLHERNINPEGHEFDRKRLGKTNHITMKAAIDRHIASALGRKTGERSEYSQVELDIIDTEFNAILNRAVEEVLNVSN